MRLDAGYCADGYRLYANVEPASSRWLPWPGRTSRWWYEIRCDKHTHAYEVDGSGGGFTLRRCIWRAYDALDDFESRWVAEHLGGRE